MADLLGTAQAVLDAVVAYYAADVTLPELPARRYVTAWTPDHDCEQVTVRFSSLFAHDGDISGQITGVGRAGLPWLLGGEFAIEVVRCAPLDDDGGPAAVADIEAYAADVSADAHAVYRAVLAASRAGDLPGCQGAGFVSWDALDPQGMFGGGRTIMRLGL